MANTPRKPWSSGAKQLDALDELLTDRPKDDKGGPDGSLGFTFQQWWAAFVIVELLATTDDDFAVGMEVKEDVAILDSATTPSRVEFCQVKKNEQAGAWTLKELYRAGTKGKKDSAPPSVLAKLYRRRHEFTGHPTKLRFVSNIGFKVPVEVEELVNSHACKLAELSAASLGLLKASISKQLSLDINSINIDDFVLHRTNLPLGGQHLMVGGMLGEHCNTERLPFDLRRPALAARVLAGEVQDRTSNTSYAHTFDDLKERLISRGEALTLLAKVAAEAKAPLQNTLDDAISRLDAEAHDFLIVMEIKQQRVRVCAAAVDRTNLVFRGLVTALSGARPTAILRSPPGAKLGDLMNSLIAVARESHSQNFNVARGYSEAVALLVLYEAINVDIFAAPTGAQSKAEE